MAAWRRSARGWSRRGAARFAAVVAVLGTAAGVVLLLLALATLLQRLRDDPATVGKRYQLTARLPDYAVDAVQAIPGVAGRGAALLARRGRAPRRWARR